MHASRDEIRLASLPHELLANLLASAMRESSTTSRLCEEAIASKSPTPEWILSEVLLSPDLAPSIFGHLRVPDRAAACVCTHWRTYWVDTKKQRRELHRLRAFLLCCFGIS
jgi:hypothetical protein